MSAPATRGSGARQCDILSENKNSPCNLLEHSVTQFCPDAQGRLIYLKEYLSDLRKALEERENAARYIHDFLEFNTNEVSPGSDRDLLVGIASDVKDTKSKITLVEREIGSLSINFDRLNTRVQNTEHKLGLVPSKEKAPIQSFKPRIMVDLRNTESLEEQQLQLQLQQQGLSPYSSTLASSSQQQGLSSHSSTLASSNTTGASAMRAGDLQKATEPMDEKKPPLVYYKGGLDGATMPAPHLDDLTEFLKNDEAMRKKLRGLGMEQPKKVRGHKPTKEEEAAYHEREKLLLSKLSETNTNMVKMLEMGKGGEGRVNRLIKQKFREISKEHGYPINPRTRRVQDLVDGDHLSELSLNWHLNTTLKRDFESLLATREERSCVLVTTHAQDNQVIGIEIIQCRDNVL